jgi:hypothetical protein
MLTLTLLPKYIYSNQQDWGNPTNIRLINSPKDDFAPCWNSYEKRLYFSSDRKGKSKLYITEIDEQGNFTEPKELSDPLNKSTTNISYISFLSETEAILNAFRKGYSQAYLNIFYTQRRSGQWQKPIPLDSLECECFMLHPTVSKDGNFVIFSSNLDDPNQLDLYIAYKRENGVWGNIEKIEELSTDGDEITPFLASNDTLYFASNGFGGPGGFDLFYSVRKFNVWQSPTPLSQLNTRYDESDFAVINDTLAIFASNNIEGLGGLDLYLARRISKEEVVSEPIPKLDLSISVQIPILRVQQEFEYELAQFPQMFPLDLLNQKYEPIPLNSNFLPSLDALIQNYLVILFQKVSLNKIEITLSYDTTKKEIDGQIKKLVEEFKQKIDSFQNLVKIEHNNSDYIIIKTQKEELFEPIQIGKFTSTYEPPILEISVNARPASLLSSFEISIRGTEINRVGYNIPFSTSIELKQDSLSGLSSADTLFIDLIAKDTAGRSYLMSYPIVLNRSSVFYKKTISFQNKKIERYYLFRPFSDFENRFDLKKILEKLAEYSQNIKSIQLVGKLDSKDPEIIELTGQIANYLHLSPSQVTLMQKTSDYENTLGKIPPRCIILLVEIK